MFVFIESVENNFFEIPCGLLQGGSFEKSQFALLDL